jgi:hypothetical protein
LHRFSGFKIILLTLFLGSSQALWAQVEESDTLGALAPVSQEIVDSLELKSAGDSTLVDSSFVPPGKESVLEFVVDYHAEDSMVVDPVTNTVYLYNEAVVVYGDIKLQAGYIRLDLNRDELFAQGLPDSTGKIGQKPIFTEAGKDYQTDTIRYNFRTQKAKIYKVITAESEGFLHGAQIKKAGDVYFMRKGYFTTCSHEEPHFKIQTNKAKVIPGKKIITGAAYLEVSDVPTPLVLPFGFFPTQEERASGIIIPTYVNNQVRGLGIQGGGYYLAINDYYDLQLVGEIYTRGGYGARGISNYAKKYKYNGRVTLGYNVLKLGEERFADFEPFQINKDFSINWTHNQDPKARPDLRFSADVNIASGTYYRVTSVNPNDFLNNQLTSSVALQKTWAGKPYSLSVNLRHSQNINTNELDLTLPQMTFNVQRFFPFKNSKRVSSRWYDQVGVTYSADAQNRVTAITDSTFDMSRIFKDYSQNGIRHNMNVNTTFKVFKYFSLNPGLNYTGRMYFERLEYSWLEQENALRTDTNSQFSLLHDFSASTDLTTKVFGIFNFKKGKVAAIRHVMTPAVNFSIRPDFSTDFWGYYQEVQRDSIGTIDTRSQFQGFIYGSPAAGRSGTLGFNLLNTLDAKLRSKKDSTGIAKISIFERLTLRTAYNIAAEEFAWAPLNTAVTANLFKRLISFNYQGTFDFYGFDEELNRRVNQSAREVNGQWLRFNNTQFSLNANFRGEAQRKKEDAKNQQAKQRAASSIGVTEGDLNYYGMYEYLDYQIPWDFGVGYSINFTNTNNVIRRIQSLNFNGSLRPTVNWSLSVNTGYDFINNDLTYTVVNITRSIHCWEMSIMWVPFGFQQSYMFGVNARANILKDAKIERRRGVGEFGF